MINFFLISTSHLENNIWFKDDEDFKVGMNYVAISSFLSSVRIIAFILMSNHVHILVECSRDEAMEFINKFKKLYGYYFRIKYGAKELLRRNTADIQEVGRELESLERVIAYILMNCVAARICLHPTGYKWGSCNCFFNQNKQKGVWLDSLSVRSRRRILRSRADLPEKWILGEDGFILPESYVCVDFVEALYGSPARMNYFLNNSSKAKKVRESSGPSFRDQIINAAMIDICHTLFHVNSPEQLSAEDRRELLSQLRRRFSADLNQLGRVTGISYTEAARMLDEL